MLTEERALIESMLLRASRLVDELAAIYLRDLELHAVSAEARNVTHEVIEKCANVLDQAMNHFFWRDIAPGLAVKPKRGGYFPAAQDPSSYRSSMGQWNAVDLEKQNPEADRKIKSLQPFASDANQVFARLRKLASEKHTSLRPQIRREQQRVNAVGHEGGSVTWDPNSVRFGSGVFICGVPVDPISQMPAASSRLTVTIERWVSFHFEDGGEDALQFCRLIVEESRRAVSTLLD